MSAAWPSLRDEVDIADALYGRRGRTLLDAWLARQAARTHDLAIQELCGPTGPPSGYDIPNNVENVLIPVTDGCAGHGG